MFSPHLTFAASELEGMLQLTRELDPDRLQPITEYDREGNRTDVLKLVDGQQMYRLPAQYIDNDGVDSSVSVRILNPPQRFIAPLTQVRLTGTVRCVPWVRNGRIAWSITADGIMPVSAAHAAADDEEE